MSIQTVALTEEQSRFVAEEIGSGHYPDAAAVVSAALRKMERAHREYERKLAILRAAIEEGDTGEVVEGDVFAEVYERIRQRAANRQA